ncbi:MAG: hypothetical protein ACRCWD_02525 [Culicoidibacterales bacterium]
MAWKLPHLFHRHHKVMTQLTAEEHQALIRKLDQEFNEGRNEPPIPTTQVISPYEKLREVDQAEHDSTFKN